MEPSLKPKFFRDHLFEFATTCLMLLGIILSFFYLQLGGSLVGFAFGLNFSSEMQAYFFKTRGYYLTEGLFKTIILVGVALYLLIAATAFVLALVIGFVIMTLIRFKRDGSI